MNNYIKYINTLDLKILGLHIRTLDGGFIDMYNESSLLNYIDNFLDKNKNWKIYVSTDNKNIEDKLISKYKDNILKMDYPFGNNYNDKFSDNNYGLMNSMVSNNGLFLPSYIILDNNEILYICKLIKCFYYN